MPHTTYLVNRQAENAVGKTTLTATAVHIGLSTTAPAIAGTGVTEPSGNAYARVATSGATWTAGSGGVVSNAAVITFAKATGNWGTATHAVAYDAATGGNLLWFAPLGTAQAITTDTTASYAIGGITVTQS